MRTRRLITSMAMLMLLAACGDDAPDASPGEASERSEAAAAPGPPLLDLATLRAEVPDGTYEAERVDAAHVGEVTPEMFIGVLLDADAADDDAAQARAYLCDGEAVVQWFAGDLAPDGSAALLPETLVEEGAPEMRVELTTGDAGTSAVVAIGHDEHPVALTEATGDAGLYTARATFGEDVRRAGWIVLPDGRQVGSECRPRCFINPHNMERICGPCVSRN